MMTTQYKTVDAYIAGQLPECIPGLEKIRRTVQKVVPEAEECISYQMPTYKYKGVLIHFAVFTTHYGLYPGANAIEKFKSKLKIFNTSKGTIRFPLDKPLPVKLIQEITRFRVRDNIAREKARVSKRKNQ